MKAWIKYVGDMTRREIISLAQLFVDEKVSVNDYAVIVKTNGDNPDINEMLDEYKFEECDEEDIDY